MRPRLDNEVKLNWIILAAVVVIGAGALAWFADWGAGAEQVDEERRRYNNRVGDLLYSEQLNRMRARNDDLSNYLLELQQQVGIREVPPFLMPPDDVKPGLYFTVVYSQIWSVLQQRANRFSVASYDYQIGFGHLGGRPPASREEVRYYLTMLQLITKAVYLGLSTPDKTVQHLAINGVDPANRRVTGPAGRPPLLIEYPFELQVHASLKDILWLLHQLSDDQLDPRRRSSVQGAFSKWLQQDIIAALAENSDQQFSLSGAEGAGNEVCPLIVRGLSVTSGNLQAVDQLEQLEVTIQLAGMEFLTTNERIEGVAEIDPDRRAAAQRAQNRTSITGTNANQVARP